MDGLRWVLNQAIAIMDGAFIMEDCLSKAIGRVDLQVNWGFEAYWDGLATFGLRFVRLAYSAKSQFPEQVGGVMVHVRDQPRGYLYFWEGPLVEVNVKLLPESLPLISFGICLVLF